jgi:hypothetical protein
MDKPDLAPAMSTPIEAIADAGCPRHAVLTSRHVAILRCDDFFCKIVFDANVDTDRRRSHRCGCNEGIEHSLRFQLGYGLDSGMREMKEAAN